MSKEEILKILEDAKDKNSDVPMRLVRQAFEKLREPCEDAISRQAAIDALDCINGTEEVLMSLPSASERKRGKWIWCGDKHVCSECDEFALCDAYDVLDTGEYQEELTDFCPYCGADMREEQDGE